MYARQFLCKILEFKRLGINDEDEVPVIVKCASVVKYVRDFFLKKLKTMHILRNIMDLKIFAL